MNADGSYNGALLVAPDANHPTAVIEQNYNLTDGHYTYTFDATHSLAQIGSNLNGATYQWQFADGTTAQGATVSKTFAHGGEQDVILKVIDGQGHSDTLVKEMPIRNVAALKMNFESNMNDSSDYTSTVAGVANPVYVDTPYGGKALQLGGAASDNITIVNAHDPDLSNLTQLTVGFSMSAKSAYNAGQISLVQNSGNWGLYLNSQTGAVVLALDGVWHNITTSGVNLADGHWHDAAFTVDQHNFTLYLDGAKTGQLSLTPAQVMEMLSPGTHGTTIGGTPSTNQFKGAIDNLYVGGTALTDKQISDMHVSNTTVGGAPTESTHVDTTPVTVTTTPATTTDHVTDILGSVVIDPTTTVDNEVAPSMNLAGTVGDDNLIGGANNDQLTGDMGQDTLMGKGGDDLLQGNRGNDQESGGDGADTMFGGKDDDYLNGNTGNDNLNGNMGNDTVHGGQGDDVVSGGQGSDRLFGDMGDDTLSGDLGADTLTGGAGNDVFVFHRGDNSFTHADIITDFHSGEDKIDLSKFVESSFSRVVLVGTDTSTTAHDATTLLLQTTTTTDGITLLTNTEYDFAVKLENTQNIQATDFLL